LKKKIYEILQLIWSLKVICSGTNYTIIKEKNIKRNKKKTTKNKTATLQNAIL